MKKQDILDLIANGENSGVEFKLDEIRPELLARAAKTSGKILAICRGNPSVTIPELALMLGITERSVQRNMQKLQLLGLLRRVGGRKEGSWEVTHEGA